MGKNSPWKHSGMNYPSNLAPPDIWRRPINPFGCAFNGNAPAPFPYLVSLNSPAALPSAHKRSFMVFDQSWDQRNPIFSSTGSQFPYSSLANLEDGTNGGEEEMHEDSDEIDALLYSDSEDDCEEEEASTGHSPPEGVTVESGEEAGSSSAMPTKRRRIDASLVDTASSVGAYNNWANGHKEEGTEMSCVRVKRERIQETVGILRRIIPGGRGKDAAAVLDEAIRYLRSLKLKARAMGGFNSVA